MTTEPAAVERLIAEAEAALEGVTDGPWVYEYTGIGHTVRQPGAYNAIFTVNHAGNYEPDARFIAWARNNVPALIAAIRELEARVEGWIAPDIVDKLLDDAQPIMAEAYCGAEAARMAAEAKLAEVEKERDTFTRANHLQANCIHLSAQALGPDYAATVDALPKAAAHVAATVATLTAQVEAMRGALLNLPPVYAHQINTGVREVYDPLQRFFTLESVLAALTTETDNG